MSILSSKAQGRRVVPRYSGKVTGELSLCYTAGGVCSIEECYDQKFHFSQNVINK